MAIFKSKKEKEKERQVSIEKKVKSIQTPPGRVTGSGIPIEKRGQYIRQQIRKQKPVTEADLLTKTEYVKKQRAKKRK